MTPSWLGGHTRVLRLSLLLTVFLPLAAESAAAQGPSPEALRRIGVIQHPPIREASGLVASRTHADVLWVITDSGGPPHLYAITSQGRLLAEYEVQDAANLDWESLAIDDQGFLYIADVGNNLRLPLRWFYQIREPNPRQEASAAPTGSARRTVKVQQILAYTFPAEAIDVEGTFALDDALLLISKVRRGTAVYRLPIPHDAPREDARVPPASAAAKLQRLGDVADLTAVTGADISSDGQRLAIVTYREVAVYRLNGDVARTLAKQPAVRVPFRASAIEGCCWRGDELLLVSEDRSLYRVVSERLGKPAGE